MTSQAQLVQRVKVMQAVHHLAHYLQTALVLVAVAVAHPLRAEQAQQLH
jgi:hypothetical protein